MNLKLFLFKLSIILLQTLKITLLLTPLVLAVRAIYMPVFDLLPELQAAIFIAFGIGMSATIWNAFEFENYRLMDLKYYLKSHQKYELNLSETLDGSQVRDFIIENISQAGNWKLISKEEQNLEFKVLSKRKIADTVRIRIQGNRVLMESKPRLNFWPLDMGRNYKNILHLLVVIKKMPFTK